MKKIIFRQREITYYRDYSELSDVLYSLRNSEGVQFLCALKILLNVVRLKNPERIAISVMEIVGSQSSCSAIFIRLQLIY